MKRPIYVVLWRLILNDMAGQRYGLRELVKVIVCDLSEWDAVYEREVLPSQRQDINPIQWQMFTRQEDEPFREIAEEGAPHDEPW